MHGRIDIARRAVLLCELIYEQEEPKLAMQARQRSIRSTHLNQNTAWVWFGFYFYFERHTTGPSLATAPGGC